MTFVREGYLYGAWVIRLHGKHAELPSNGSGFPELDELYVPKKEVASPKRYSDYTNMLVDGAIDRLLSMLR
jgi:hypothetical protein